MSHRHRRDHLGEVVAVLAARAPDLRDALERASKDGFSHVILDGKIIACDRCREPAVSDLADKEAALAAHSDSFFTIPHFDAYRAVLIRLPRVTGIALREAITDGWLACAPSGSPRISSPASQSAVVSTDRAS